MPCDILTFCLWGMHGGDMLDEVTPYIRWEHPRSSAKHVACCYPTVLRFVPPSLCTVHAGFSGLEHPVVSAVVARAPNIDLPGGNMMILYL